MANFSIEQIENNLIKYIGMMDFDINPEYFKHVYEIRRRMHEDIYLDGISNIEYKKIILEVLKKQYQDIFINFTDSELINNIIENSLPEKGMKVTKYLARFSRYDNRIDVFHTNIEGRRITITANPLDFIELYDEIGTCMSPEGENQHAFLELLLSPYAYIAYDDTKNHRMIVLVDYEKKIFFPASVYGCGYNIVLPYSVSKYFVEKGFTSVRYASDYFDTESLSYSDFGSNYHLNFPVFEGRVQEEKPERKRDIFEQLLDYRIDRDAIEGYAPVNNSYHIVQLFDKNGYISLSSGVYCEICGESVDEDDYDFDLDCCNSCADENYVYCEKCERDIYIDEYNFDLNMCDSCAEDYVECEECSDLVHKSNIDEEFHCCKECAEQFSKCVVCNDIYHKDDIDENGVCIDCKENENQEG